MTIECSQCPRTWDHPGKILTRKSLIFHLSEDGWTRDLTSNNAWLCPECTEELEINMDNE